MSAAEAALSDVEAGLLFEGLQDLPGLVVAVSGGADSTALLVLIARWAARRKQQKKTAPALLAVTVDHGLRAGAAREAATVKELSRRLGLTHRTLRWREAKPKSGLQEAARGARYRLLAQAAKRFGYAHILTAHTLDDQAETVLFRLCRGSGLGGLGGMARVSSLAAGAAPDLFLLRPFLSVPKTRLVATLKAAGIGHSEDPTNRDPRFARPRLRALLPELEREGLDARGLARLAARLRRAEAALEFAVDAAAAALAPSPWPSRGPIVLPSVTFGALPAEVALRLLGRAIAHAGDEGPVELGKLERLYAALAPAGTRLRRTLAGAMVTLSRDRLTVERAPPRQRRGGGRAGNRGFTKSA